ncbi:MAG: methyltransferase domain-containing protein [Nitriliruptorales bacterium]|nr:methyltransferase domain-containing protein [Nitriliruptorales bacterium]
MGRSRRTERDERRRALGQNFLRDREVIDALTHGVRPGEVVVDVGAGTGALTLPLARAGAQVLAIEADPVWGRKLKQRVRSAGLGDRVDVVVGDLRRVQLPGPPYRVVACPPYDHTTALLRRLLDDPVTGPERADLVLQWEVARKRAARPPTTLLSTGWAPWWEIMLVGRIPASAFRPRPTVDSGWLAVRRREPALLPAEVAGAFADFLRARWGGWQGRGDRSGGEG